MLQYTFCTDLCDQGHNSVLVGSCPVATGPQQLYLCGSVTYGS